MRVTVTAPIQSRNGIIHPGAIIDIPPEIVDRLKGKVEPVPPCAEAAVDLWRWFLAEADQIYRPSVKTVESWEQCQVHVKTAEALADTGDIPTARAELEKALQALKGSPMEQQNLL